MGPWQDACRAGRGSGAVWWSQWVSLSPPVLCSIPCTDTSQTTLAVLAQNVLRWEIEALSTLNFRWKANVWE